MKFNHTKIIYGAVFLVALLLSACGGGATAPAAPAPTYTIGGTLSGLSGTGLVLQNNAGDNLAVSANGAFTFATKVANGSLYSVTVLTQPTGMTCSVSTGAGTVSGNSVSNVAVVCSNNAYDVGGTVAGLMGVMVLQDNNGDNLTVAANGNGFFTFATKVAYASPYSVTVFTQPTGKSCSVAGGTGTMGTASIANIAITCTINTYTIGGNVSLLNGGMMVLQNNGADNKTVAVNGPFNFPTAVAYGNTYNVSVLTQPAKQICSVSAGTGSVTANVSNVGISCASQMGGAMQGIPLNLAPTVSTLAGVAASFNFPGSITSDGSNLYVADTSNNKIRKIVIATGVVTTLAGTGAAGAADGAATAATFNNPFGITTDGANLYVADTYNYKIRKIVISTGVVSSFTGVVNTTGAIGAADGAAAATTFNQLYGITSDGNNLYVADALNNKIRKIVIATGVVSSFTGVANTAVAFGAADGAGTAATFNYPQGITSDGSNLYVADNGNRKIRKIVIATGAVSSLTGAANTAVAFGAADGAGTAATFSNPTDITSDGSNLYVADSGNNKIRKIVIATGVVSSLTGVTNAAGVVGAVNGVGAAATFNAPYGITSDGTNLYVTDQNNNTIRKIQ